MPRALGVALGTGLAVVSFASCGGGALYGGDPATPFHAAGPRLRPFVDDVEGVRLVTGWFDRELGKRCAFDSPASAPDPDGVSWCLPRLGEHAAGFGPFLDTACTVPIGTPPPDADVPYVRVRPFDACEGGLTFYEAGEVVPARGYVRDGASCVPDPDARTKRLVRLGDAVTPPFARAVEAVVGRGGRIDAVVRTASDGSSEVVGGFDRERGEPVRATWTRDRRLRWLPLREAFGHGTGHASCAGVASKLKHNALCPISVVATVVTDPGGCGVALHAIGPRLSGSDLAARCPADVGADDTFFFGTGGALPEETFAAAGTVDVGTGRIRIRAFADGPSAIVRKAFYDVATGSECVPAPAVDGARRCLPSATAAPAFLDAACSVAAAEDTMVGCDRLGAGSALRIAAGERYGAYVLEGEHAAVFRRDGERCVASGMGYAVRELAPETFAIATEIRE